MIKDLLKEGFALKRQKHYKQAIKIFYKALEQDNTSSELFYEIADLYHLMGNEEKTLWYIQQALNIDSLHINSLNLLKEIFLSKKAYSEAEQTAINIYEITHSDLDFAELLRILNTQGKYTEVLKFYGENNEPAVLVEFAKSYYFQNDVDSAIKILEKCLQISPKNQEAMIFLGRIYYDKGCLDRCYNIAKSIKEDNNPECLNFLGLVACKQSAYQKASCYFKQAIKCDIKNDEYYFNLANCYYLIGNMDGAKRYYKIALSKNPENPHYKYALAKLYYVEKQYKMALNFISDDLFDARVLKSIILCETGYLALARQEVLKLLTEQPENETIKQCKNKIDEELGFVKA